MTGLVSSVDDNNTRSINTDGQLSGSLKSEGLRLASRRKGYDLINRTSRGERRGGGREGWNKWKAIKMNKIIGKAAFVTNETRSLSATCTHERQSSS